MRIADRELGPGHPVFIVAEIGANHNGSLEDALALVEYAAEAGADAVKFQLFTPDDMTRDSDEPRFTLQSGPWAGRKLYELYAEAMTPQDWFRELFATALRLGIVPFASVFSLAGVEFLEQLDCPAYKIASPEIGWWELIRVAAKTRKPVIISTGAATAEEIATAVRCVPASRRVVLYCHSTYPAPLGGFGLKEMIWCADYYGVSDHSRAVFTVPMAAAALGLHMIEKHLMLPAAVENTLDEDFSLTPREFGRMVQAVRNVEAVCHPDAQPDESDAAQFRRRLVNGQWLRCGPEPALTGKESS